MLEPWRLGLLFGTGLVAGFVDSIAGGGGLITLPVLLSVGLSPQDAIATNKLQSTCGSGSAAWRFMRAGAVSFKDCRRAFVYSLVGAVAGSLAVKQVDPSFLKRAIPVLLIAVAIYTLLKPELGSRDLHPRMKREWFDLVLGLGIGFYDGFFGPGTGTFWTMGFMLLLGFNMTRATANTKVVNFASNIGSLGFFLAAGGIHFAAGAVMGVGQLLGARIGSGMVLERGTKFIRPIFIAAVLAITLKLLFGAF